MPVVLDLLTREERLMEQARVREHHWQLYQGYEHGGRREVAAYKEHIKLHQEAARRLRLERQK